MLRVLFILGAAAAYGAAVPDALGDFLTASTGLSYRDLGAPVWACSDALPAASPLRSDGMSGGKPGEPKEVYVARVISRELGASELFACLLEAGFVSYELLERAGPDLALATITASGRDARDPVRPLRLMLEAAPSSLVYSRDQALLLGLSTRTEAPVFCTPPLAPPALDWLRTSSQTADAFTLLHAALAHDKQALRHRSVQDLLFEDPAAAEPVAREYRALGATLAAALAATGEDARAVAVLRAARRLAMAPAVDDATARRMGSESVSGKNIRLADKSMLDSTLASLAAAEVLAATARVHGNYSLSSVTDLSLRRRVPRLAHLLAAQDRFGRSPFHIAALTDNAYAIRGVLHTATLAALQERTDGSSHHAIAATAVHLRDAAGLTPRALATMRGHWASAEALAELEAAVSRAYPAVVIPPSSATPVKPRHALPDLTPPRPDTVSEEDAGGWCAPEHVGSKARAAVEAFRAYSPHECDVDVIDYKDCSPTGEAAGHCGITPEAFLQHYMHAARPLLLRGYARRYPAFVEWTPAEFIARHGAVAVQTSEIPYAAQWGVGQSDDLLPLGLYVSALLGCAPPSNATGRPSGPSQQCRTPLTPLAPDLCDLFTADDAQHVRAIGEAPRPSTRRYVFHSVSRDEGGRDPATTRLHTDIIHSGLTPHHLTVQLPLFSTKGGSQAPSHIIDSVELDARGGASHARAAAELPPSACSVDLLHTDQEVIQLYVGGPGSGAPLHYHQDAVNTLLHGIKHWYLQPPSPQPGGGGTPSFGTVDIASFITKVLPALEPAERPLQCTQRSGDVMFVPYAWGHGCFNSATSIGWAAVRGAGAREEGRARRSVLSCSAAPLLGRAPEQPASRPLSRRSSTRTSVATAAFEDQGGRARARDCLQNCLSRPLFSPRHRVRRGQLRPEGHLHEERDARGVKGAMGCSGARGWPAGGVVPPLLLLLRRRRDEEVAQDLQVAPLHLWQCLERR